MSLDDHLAELWATGASLTDIGVKLGESRGVIAGRIRSVAQGRRREIRAAACNSAWNKDPVFGVIGIQSGPRG